MYESTIPQLTVSVADAVRRAEAHRPVRKGGLSRPQAKERHKFNIINALANRLVCAELVDGYQDLWARQLLGV